MSAAEWCSSGLLRDQHLIENKDLVIVYPLAYYENYLNGIEEPLSSHIPVDYRDIFMHIYTKDVNFYATARVDFFHVCRDDAFGRIISWPQGSLRHHVTYYPDAMICLRLESTDPRHPSNFCIITVGQFHAVLVSLQEYFKQHNCVVPESFATTGLGSYNILK